MGFVPLVFIPITVFDPCLVKADAGQKNFSIHFLICLDIIIIITKQ